VAYSERAYRYGSIYPSRIKGRAINRMGDQFWRWTRRAIIFSCFLGRAIFFREKHWGKLDGRQIFVRKTGDKKIFGGRASPNYRPSFYTGGGVTTNWFLTRYRLGNWGKTWVDHWWNTIDYIQFNTKLSIIFLRDSSEIFGVLIESLIGPLYFRF